MRRISLIALAIVAIAAVAALPAAAAKPAAKTCTTHSKNVIGKTVKGTLTASNVNSVQARFATCGQAKKVMNGALSLRIEMPKSIAAFYCVPTVYSTSPDVVGYKCTFKGADTPMYVKLTFRVKYNLD